MTAAHASPDRENSGRDNAPASPASGPASSREGATRAHAMPFGAELQPDSTVRFRLWAPAENGVTLVLEDTGDVLLMEAGEGGWHELIIGNAGPGSRYRFELGNGLKVPDPASRHQPAEVHGSREVIVPPDYRRSDAAW